jgi:HlyD family secretion protein
VKTSALRQPRRWLIPLVALALVIAAVVWLRQRPVAADAVTVTAAPLRQSLVFSARVASVARTDLAATVTGRVARVLVREGDRVRAGQTVVELEADELTAQAAQARAALASAEARLKAQAQVSEPVSRQSVAQARSNAEFALRELDRARALFNQGFIGQARLQEAERAAQVAQAALAAAEAQAAGNTPGGVETAALAARVREAQAALALAEARLGQTRIVAPAAGRIVTRSVEPGDVVQPARRILTLAADGETRLIAQVDEKNLALLREGLTATASTDAFPDRPFTATLNFLAPAADAARGTVEARLAVKEPPAFLRDDMTVSVEVVTAERANTLAVPAGALRESDGKTQLLVAEDGVARLVPVRAGIRTPQRVEIVEGVAAGATVIVDAAIKPGQRVRPQVAAPRAAGGGLEGPMTGAR